MPRSSRAAWKVYKNVFDQFTQEILIKLQAQGHFDELMHQMHVGKEANVFLANKGEEFVAVKIYRLQNCNFNKMHEYLSHDERYFDVKNNKRKIVLAWVQREYANLFLAREHISCPTPHTFRGNIIVMDLIGHESNPAPMLKDKKPKNPKKFYEECKDMIEKLRKGGLVHGDISAFNILNHDEQPVFIDFSQATTVTSPRARELYERDMKNLEAFFSKKH